MTTSEKGNAFQHDRLKIQRPFVRPESIKSRRPAWTCSWVRLGLALQAEPPFPRGRLRLAAPPRYLSQGKMGQNLTGVDIKARVGLVS
jgi:hypothetical protein